jgi:hypothetical protein
MRIRVESIERKAASGSLTEQVGRNAAGKSAIRVASKGIQRESQSKRSNPDKCSSVDSTYCNWTLVSQLRIALNSEKTDFARILEKQR